MRLGPGQRILLCGGAGFVASHLADRLSGLGCSVVAVDNLITGTTRNLAQLASLGSFAFVEADASAGLPSHPALAAPFDAVLHFASPASPVDFGRIPIEILRAGSLATFHLLERALADGARFLLASTSEVYGDPQVHPQPESYWGNVNPVGPRSVYDEAKRFSEALTMAYRSHHGLSVGILRIFNTYGPRMRPDDGRVIPAFIAQALANQPLTVHGHGGQTRSICYVDDLVTGIVALLESDEPGPVNCGTDYEISMLQLAEKIIFLSGSSSRIRFTERPVDDPERRRPDLTLAHELLGYRPRTLPDIGLSHTIQYFQRLDREQCSRSVDRSWEGVQRAYLPRVIDRRSPGRPV